MRKYTGEGGRGGQGSFFSAGCKARSVRSFLSCLHLLSLTKQMGEVPSFPEATRRRSRQRVETKANLRGRDNAVPGSSEILSRLFAVPAWVIFGQLKSAAPKQESCCCWLPPGTSLLQFPGLPLENQEGRSNSPGETQGRTNCEISVAGPPEPPQAFRPKHASPIWSK